MIVVYIFNCCFICFELVSLLHLLFVCVCFYLSLLVKCLHVHFFSLLLFVYLSVTKRGRCIRYTNNTRPWISLEQFFIRNPIVCVCVCSTCFHCVTQNYTLFAMRCVLLHCFVVVVCSNWMYLSSLFPCHMFSHSASQSAHVFSL